MGDRLHDRVPDLRRLLRRLGNPLTSEAAAFRWLLAITACLAVVTAAVLLVRAVA